MLHYIQDTKRAEFSDDYSHHFNSILSTLHSRHKKVLSKLSTLNTRHKKVFSKLSTLNT